MKKKVIIGMSGGVDSSVAAYILKEQGYEVIGVTLKIWQENFTELEEDGSCCGIKAVDDARSVANKLDIPYYVLNFKKDFNEKVIKYFINEYIEGKTPNPCIACNKYIKWESLLDKAITLGADYIATGHYAKIIKNKFNRLSLEKSIQDSKDQTYALYNLNQFQLEKTLMPVGDYTKDQIRDIARKIGLSVADKKDSQEICFIPDKDYGKFIKENVSKKIESGNFVDLNGKILGRHEGIFNYTIGQRKGLKIAFGTPMYVNKIKPITNEVVLSNNEDLFVNSLKAENINFMGIDKFDGEIEVFGKIRYNQKPAPCKIKIINNVLEASFEQPQRAITPGQAAVFYIDNFVACGGTIVN